MEYPESNYSCALEVKVVIYTLTMNKSLSMCLWLLGLVILSDSQYVSGGFTVNDSQYTLRWEVLGPYVTFRAVARGTGYVGFGISPGGTMVEADLFVSGVYDNGTTYAIVRR